MRWTILGLLLVVAVVAPLALTLHHPVPTARGIEVSRLYGWLVSCLALILVVVQTSLVSGYSQGGAVGLAFAVLGTAFAVAMAVVDWEEAYRHMPRYTPPVMDSTAYVVLALVLVVTPVIMHYTPRNNSTTTTSPATGSVPILSCAHPELIGPQGEIMPPTLVRIYFCPPWPFEPPPPGYVFPPHFEPG